MLFERERSQSLRRKTSLEASVEPLSSPLSTILPFQTPGQAQYVVHIRFLPEGHFPFFKMQYFPLGQGRLNLDDPCRVFIQK